MRLAEALPAAGDPDLPHYPELPRHHQHLLQQREYGGVALRATDPGRSLLLNSLLRLQRFPAKQIPGDLQEGSHAGDGKNENEKSGEWS